ncbi:hypothetical protein Desde_4135 [Desulfitobacterium dehalogenans ATCC 51507]|uniref:Uncharacterized protein n=1 Tax=Desulfitobacterium dehalogenans (strain ATCC 51507 / DSM 9161 / JW/IU-DC1) TaxID=756499 RepID=I4AEL1_DESDJ|nr:hypothetical protein [Desulfitobacterium dehalogenans]AFM02396.1 hypothetical protein Desde_4135 [Desulfitobacterium dehalogenans ATCC 51507]
METALGYIQNFWGLLLVVAVFIIYLISLGRTKAGKIVLSLMLRLEKQAEEYALQTGEEKFGFVVEKGYQLLPKYVRLIFSYKMFVELADRLYDDAKNYLMSLEGKTLTAPVKDDKEADPG